MKLIKCKKCGAVVMTAETLLASMQDEYDELVRKSRKAKGGDKHIIAQQLKHIHKMMVAVCHTSSDMALRKDAIYNEYNVLRKYIVDNKLIPFDELDKIRDKARADARQKAEDDAKKLDTIYGDYESMLTNRTKADPTAQQALRKT